LSIAAQAKKERKREKEKEKKRERKLYGAQGRQDRRAREPGRRNFCGARGIISMLSSAA